MLPLRLLQQTMIVGASGGGRLLPRLRLHWTALLRVGLHVPRSIRVWVQATLMATSPPEVMLQNLYAAARPPFPGILRGYDPGARCCRGD